MKRRRISNCYPWTWHPYDPQTHQQGQWLPGHLCREEGIDVPHLYCYAGYCISCILWSLQSFPSYSPTSLPLYLYPTLESILLWWCASSLLLSLLLPPSPPACIPHLAPSSSSHWKRMERRLWYKRIVLYKGMIQEGEEEMKPCV